MQGAFLATKPLEITSLLIIAPHPDDEILGCGGLISRCVGSGKTAYLVFLTSGEGSHAQCCSVREDFVGSTRERLAVEAAAAVGVSPDKLKFLHGKDRYLPRKNENGFCEFAKKIAEQVELLRPEAVFCPHPFEGWPDHIAAEELARAACSQISHKPRLFHYCVWFWHSMPLSRAVRVKWRKARLLDIAGELPLKKKAMKIYLRPEAPCGNPWVGELPSEFVKAFDWGKELFFEVETDPRPVKE